MAISAWDAHKNLAISTVAGTAPGTAGTTITVTTGQGSRFGTGALTMNATVCPANTTPDPTNSEIVRITNISTDSFTVTRTVEGSSNRNIAVGDVIFAGPSVKSLTDIETAVGNLETPPLANSNNVVTGTTYTTVLADQNTYIDCSNASAVTITIAAQSSVNYAIGTTIVVTQKGAGAVTVQVASPDTLNSYSPSSSGTQGAGGTALTSGQWAAVTLRKVGSQAWVAYGAK